VGSSIFNILFILGTASMISKGGLGVPDTAIYFDIPVMTAVAVACLPIFFTGRRLDRWEGGVFLVYYIAYTIYLILASQKGATLEMFTMAMTWFVVPLTLLTLVVVGIREMRQSPKKVTH
jgi:cation:H+ antiporter